MTQSEQHVGGALTDSMLHEILAPGYLPDISSLQVPFGTDASGGIYSGPYLEILEQPKTRGFRFRYPCEGPSHGGLPGEFSNSKNKTYPSIQINNFTGSCRIVVTLVTCEEPYVPHAHSLTGKNAKDGVVTVQIGQDQGMTASFPNLGIQHVTKKMVIKVLMERYIKLQALQNATFSALAENNKGGAGFPPFLDMQGQAPESASDIKHLAFDPTIAQAVAGEEATNIRKIVEQQARNMDLSAIRLCFQAYLPDALGNFTKPLKPVYSVIVKDSKSPSASQLKICRMDRNSGSVTGGDEIFLLCDKVQKDDIELRFYEFDDNTGKSSWEECGQFSPSDVHRQFAIVFKTPPYWNIAIEKPATVLLELRRKSDKASSDPVEFTYQPQVFDKEQIGAKRRKKVPNFSDYYPGGPGGPPGGAGGAGDGGGGGGFIGFNFGASFAAFANMPSTSQQYQDVSSSRGTQRSTGMPHSDKPQEAALQELALAVLERTSSAVRDYAATGDVRYLLAIQQQLTAVQDEEGDSALHLAIINCQFEAIESLVSVMSSLPDAVINQYNYMHQTPLHLAILTRQPLATESLLRANADATLRDRHGNTPVHTACAQGDVSCLRVLLNSHLRQTTDTLPELNWQNYSGFTPVHLGTIRGNKEILKLLHAAGADMEAKDGTCGRSPLHHAVEANNLPIAGFFILEVKCDVNATTYDYHTPLHVAAGRGLEGQTAVLVAAGADTMATNDEDETPYDLASTDQVRQILEEQVVPEDPASYDADRLAGAVGGLSISARTSASAQETTANNITSHNSGANEKVVKAIVEEHNSGMDSGLGDSGFGSESVSGSASAGSSYADVKRPLGISAKPATTTQLDPSLLRDHLARPYQNVQ